MTRIFKAAFAGAALAALASTASAQVATANQCESEGGEVFDVAEGKVCMVPIRAEEYQGEAYDGQQLGVTECMGTEMMEGEWCKIVLVPAPAQPAPAEIEAEASN